MEPAGPGNPAFVAVSGRFRNIAVTCQRTGVCHGLRNAAVSMGWILLPCHPQCESRVHACWVLSCLTWQSYPLRRFYHPCTTQEPGTLLRNGQMCHGRQGRVGGQGNQHGMRTEERSTQRHGNGRERLCTDICVSCMEPVCTN